MSKSNTQQALKALVKVIGKAVRALVKTFTDIAASLSFAALHIASAIDKISEAITKKERERQAALADVIARVEAHRQMLAQQLEQQRKEAERLELERQQQIQAYAQTITMKPNINQSLGDMLNGPRRNRGLEQ